ncbi:hypothetical protein CsSME_00030471 [Camellia sinensis var. sinensis]
MAVAQIHQNSSLGTLVKVLHRKLVLRFGWELSPNRSLFSDVSQPNTQLALRLCADVLDFHRYTFCCL